MSAASFDAGSVFSSSIWNTELIPPDVLTGFGDLRVKSLLGLITIGSGLLLSDCATLDFRSNMLTSDVVGGMGDESGALSVSAHSSLFWYVEDSLLGFGGAAGFLAVLLRDKVVPPVVLGLRGGARSEARKAACCDGDLGCPLAGSGTPKFGASVAFNVGIGFCALLLTL